ncbi:MAG: HEAT repeat protein [Pirellulaceae bacterium]|jgi:HEAT repeat protein
MNRLILFSLLIFSVLAAGCGQSGSGIPSHVIKQLAELPDEDPVELRVAANAKSVPIGPALPDRREWGVRESVAEALARMGQAAVPYLQAALSDSDPEIRRYAIQGLSRIGPNAAAATQQLTAIVVNEQESVELRKAAALAISQIGPPAASAIPALMDVLRREPPTTQ